jgi:hypothetical protein
VDECFGFEQSFKYFLVDGVFFSEFENSKISGADWVFLANQLGSGTTREQKEKSNRWKQNGTESVVVPRQIGLETA